MIWARRVDSTHANIIGTLRATGWAVADTSRLSNFADAVAHKHGDVRLIEIKTGNKPLTSSQLKLIAQGFPVYVLRCREDALELLALAPEER